MSAHLKEKLKKVEQILQLLAEESEKGIPIIVEGRNDVKTLRKLGVNGKIVSAKTGGKTRLDLISEIERSKARCVILLLDFDRRGKEWTNYLQQQLEKMSITVDMTFWAQLMGLVGREVKDIEGLAAYLETLKQKVAEKGG